MNPNIRESFNTVTRLHDPLTQSLRETPNIEEISAIIVDAGFHLHQNLGPGLLVSVYEVIMARMLEQRGLMVERQKPIPIEFQGMKFDEGFRGRYSGQSIIFYGTEISRENGACACKASSKLSPTARPSVGYSH